MSRPGPFEENTIVVGDCIEVMAQLPDGCVDAIVTDPPYGLEFMGKEWDRFSGYFGDKDSFTYGEFALPRQRYRNIKCPECHKWIYDHPGRACECGGVKRAQNYAYQSWTTAWATEAYRILKPGGYMLVMGGTRTHHRLGCGLEDAGFEIRDELAWIYAAGFPKNYDVSKGIDKRAGAERKKLGNKYVAPRQVERGTYRDEWPAEEYDQSKNQQVYGEYAGSRERLYRGVPATPEAQYWEGYGTALKPAHEPIWLCKKPNEGTYVDNVLRHGCGAMNIDGSRVEYQSMDDKDSAKPRGRITGCAPFESGGDERKCGFPSYGRGRWPPNVIVDCYPEEFMGGVVIEGEAQLHHGGPIRAKTSIGDGNIYQGGGPGLRREPDESSRGNGLLGPYTRFFVIPKPSKAEKNIGCMELYWRKEKGGDHALIDREEWERLGKEEGRIYKETGKRVRLRARGNIHVTVKPVRLMRWLIKLITPHQHPVVLIDPFCGSGTSLVAGLELNREEGYQIDFYGMDKEENSIIITNARPEAEKRYLC